jgi:hypothetical protein
MSPKTKKICRLPKCQTDCLRDEWSSTCKYFPSYAFPTWPFFPWRINSVTVVKRERIIQAVKQNYEEPQPALKLVQKAVLTRKANFSTVYRPYLHATTVQAKAVIRKRVQWQILRVIALTRFQQVNFGSDLGCPPTVTSSSCALHS